MAAITTIVHILEVAVLLVAFGCCMTAAITVGLTSNQLQMCILSASVENVGDIHFTVTPSSDSRCQFCVVTEVIGLLLALVFIVYRIQVLCRRKCEIQVFGRFIVLIVFGLMLFFLFVVACLVTAGINTFCGNLLALEGGAWPETCAGFQEITWTTLATGTEVNGAHFYDYLKAAEAASWIAVLLWVTLVAISLVTCCMTRRQHKQQARASHTAAAAKPVVT
ncbi:uncharacterized protein LOC119729077 [Patiria miniata]|uniref:Transmembrane protein n=1 Tax=Patiria miniata TaxID=46514 RepID=A0A914A1J8_PATMI|nr:uncharacterized protein LOC119729077 [Patiria miniata]